MVAGASLLEGSGQLAMINFAGAGLPDLPALINFACAHQDGPFGTGGAGDANFVRAEPLDHREPAR